MKIKEGFMLRNVAGTQVVVPLGKEAADFSGMITLNETGAFLWKKLAEKACTDEELTEALMQEYEVSAEEAGRDVHQFAAGLKENGLAES